MTINKVFYMKKGSTWFLRLVIIGMGLLAFGLFGILLPIEMKASDAANSYLFFWVLLYSANIPFYFCLFQGWKLLGYIDKNTAFSINSLYALDQIKYAATTMSLLCLSCLPWVFRAADEDDAPGMILIWTALAGSPLVIAVFAALLRKLLQNAIEIKSENDLTV